MAVSAASPTSRPPVRAHLLARAVVPVALAALAVVSVAIRSGRLDSGYWIDEGISVGIADRPAGDILAVLRQDGSPPLYYLLLHAWMRLVGDRGEQATHALSLVFATLSIVVAWALARSLFGSRAGWATAVLFALNPFLTVYAQETRMYSLVVVLGTIACATFVGAFALGRGAVWLAGFAASTTALLYTHNWGLFLGGALAVAWGGLVVLAGRRRRRELARDGLLAAAVIAVAYLPWVPSMLFQAAHTGAPWALAPNLDALRGATGWLFGPGEQYVLLLGAGAGLAAVAGRRGPREWTPEMRAAAALAVAGLGTVLLAWLASQLAPSWAVRYLAVALAPLLLLAALGLARAGALGLVALALVATLWAGASVPASKSNVRELAREIAPGLRGGDLVLSTQPEQIPVLHHYLRDVRGLRWATITGPVADLGVTDWRDGVRRLRAAEPRRDLLPLLERLRPGERVALVQPVITSLDRWRAPWTSAVRERSAEWEQVLRTDARFRVVSVLPETIATYRNPVRATVFLRVPDR